MVIAALAMQASYRHQEFVNAIWPGEDVEADGIIDTRVRDKLHSTLKLVRAQLDVGQLLSSEYPHLELSRSPAEGLVVTSDADDFDTLRKSPDLDDGIAALRLVRGDLAEGLNTDTYQEEWLTARREQFHKRLSLLLTRLTHNDDSADVPSLLDRVLSGEAAAIADDLSSAPRAVSPQIVRNRELITWLAARFEESPENLTARLSSLPHSHRLGNLSAAPARTDVASVLQSYYEPFATNLRPLTFSVGASEARFLSVVSRPEWMGLNVELLNPQAENAVLAPGAGQQEMNLDLDVALRRLREVEATGTRLINNSLYRLLDIEVDHTSLNATYALDDFATYAFTFDCLEGELVAAIAAGDHVGMPLRDRYLPDIKAVEDLRGRVCAGGPVALFAAARPPDMGYGGTKDYVLLIQERSHEVLNVTGRLAVIPKAFHQPLVEPAAEVTLMSSIRRELEEELMGRSDLDPISDDWVPLIDPQSTSRLSAPMRWLAEREGDDQWRVELTGFGLNLVSGNFEFATLIVVDDEEWWRQYGGVLELGWETSGIVRYSSLDKQGLEMLLSDEKWSNEGLFAVLCGLQRLNESGRPSRVNLPPLQMGAV